MGSSESVAVVGGAMGGLAAAHHLAARGRDVTLYERQRYDEKRVNCGEAMTAASAVPLAKTPENGFVNPVPAFEVSVRVDGRHLGTGTFPAEDGFVTDRNAVERAWAERLSARGVAVETGRGVTKAEFRELGREHDLVVDATGQPSLSSKVCGATDEYAGWMVALNADATGDVADLHPRARIVFEGYLGYAWAFPKSETRANVGVGWHHPPEDYFAALRSACERNGWPVPDRAATNVDVIPRGPSLDPERLHLPELNAVRVGDAAGIANRFTGKGISQAIHSARLLADCVAAGRVADYPRRLHRSMRAEYLLSSLATSVVAAGRSDLLAAMLDAAAGVDIEDVDRRAQKALSRLLRRPVLAARLFAVPAVRRAVWTAARNDWECRRRSPGR
ncbi:NAD(P)/FAD-dependent oxidoreductase [halophilic archaeon]|nr:NAD(P)/FAD-dependent oxidoreductase [halophilic archaeon]